MPLQNRAAILILLITAALMFLLFYITQSRYESKGNTKQELSKQQKIWYSYLYFQKVSEREAGCKGDGDFDCTERFNRIWPAYLDKIKKDFNIDGAYFDKILKINTDNMVQNKDWSDNRLSETELKSILKIQ